MSKKVVLLVMLSLLLVALAACGGGGAETTDTGGEAPVEPIGDAANGEKLFSQAVIGSNNSPGCITCHSLEPDVVIVGPSQAGLGTRAATRVAGQSAEEYIRNSILNPNDYVVEGFAEGVMYQNYAEELTEQEIDDIVAYTLTLK